MKSITGGGYAINTPPNIRQEVLRLAARGMNGFSPRSFSKSIKRKNLKPRIRRTS